LTLQRHRSSAVPLAWLYAGLIVYASLYPFIGWRALADGPFDFLLLGWPRWWTWFDFVANGVGYLPLGFLLFVAFLRSARSPMQSVGLAIALGTLLSLFLEVAQNYLPRRVASNVDFGLNALGAASGALVGALLHGRGGIEQWQKLRERWFVARSAGGTALLVLWPVGLLIPTAVPFGLGQVTGRVEPLIVELLRDTPGEAWATAWFDGDGAAVSVAAQAVSISPAAEMAIVVLGLLAPCLIAFTVAIPGGRRSLIVLGTLAVGCATTTLSTALGFGPQNALSWTTPLVLQAIVVGAVAAALLSFVPARVAAGFGLIALTALVMLVARAPADPYFALSLQGWEQGRFIHFHGAAQWVGWAWPYAGLTYLLVRLAMRAPRRVTTAF